LPLVIEFGSYAFHPDIVKTARKGGHAAQVFLAVFLFWIRISTLDFGEGQVMDSSPGGVTELLVELGAGNPDAEAKPIPLVYEQLHRLAAHYMRRERPERTLQPTASVNEACLSLVAHRKEFKWENRAHFVGVAARLMRQILLEHARAHQAEKRGVLVQKISLDEDLEFSPERSKELVALDDALKRLHEPSPRQSPVVEFRFFRRAVHRGGG